MDRLGDGLQKTHASSPSTSGQTNEKTSVIQTRRLQFDVSFLRLVSNAAAYIRLGGSWLTALFLFMGQRLTHRHEDVVTLQTVS